MSFSNTFQNYVIIFQSFLSSRYDKGQEGFVHTFKLINHGPSYTNQDKILKLYFPNSDLTSLVKTPKINNITCRKEIIDEPVHMNISIPSDENPFGCATGQCIVLSCTIPRYWKKDQEKEIDLEVKSNPSVAQNQTFTVYSIASIDDHQTMALTKMSKVQLGAIERLVQNWPIVLGVLGGIAVILGTFLVLWRTGILAKMRPYKLDEEEVKIEKRKTQIRRSEVPLRDVVEEPLL